MNTTNNTPKGEIACVVYRTSDYNLFKKLQFNRDITESRKEKLIASLSAREIMCPIVVNENFEIIDGQARYEAKKELGRPIEYIIDPGADISDCRRMNAYNTKWTPMDYAKSYAESGNQNYARILQCYEDTGLALKLILRLAGKSATNDKGNAFANGKTIYTEHDLEVSKRVIRDSYTIRDALQFDGKLNEAFFKAVKIATEFPEYDHEWMIKKCKEYKTRYTQMSQLEDALKQFSVIYNHNIKRRKRIYFEDYMRDKGHHVRDYDMRREEPDISTLR